MRNAPVVAVLLSTLAGCVQAPAYKPELGRVYSGPPVPTITCRVGSDCDTKWGRTLVWVNKNAQYRVSIATDMLIQTHGPSTAALNVTKTANGDGTFSIVPTITCDRYACDTTDDYLVRVSFYEFVTGTELRPK